VALLNQTKSGCGGSMESVVAQWWGRGGSVVSSVP